jgi:hypothetical protein
MRFLIIFLFRGEFLCIVLLHTEGRPPSCAGYILCLLRKCQERGRKEKKKSISSGCLSRFAGSWGLAWHHPSSSLSSSCSFSSLHPLILERLPPILLVGKSRPSCSLVSSLIAYSASSSTDISAAFFCFFVGWLVWVAVGDICFVLRKKKGKR